MGLLSSGMAMLTGQLAAAAGGTKTPTYIVLATGQTINLVGAWGGALKPQADDRDPGQRVTSTQRDYLIPVASLVVGLTPFLPAKGDRITDPNIPDPVTAAATVWEVMPADGEQTWTFSDPNTRTLLRVRTKRVS